MYLQINEIKNREIFFYIWEIINYGMRVIIVVARNTGLQIKRN